MKAYKKRLIMDAATIIMLFLAVVFIRLMNDYMGEIEPIYIQETQGTGLPFNIGFRWSVILGMAGVILIQVVMYIWTYCNKRWKLFTWATGIWLYTVIVFDYVSFSGKMALLGILSQDLQYGNPIYDIWDGINIFEVIVLAVIGLVFLEKWLFGTNEKSSHTLKLRSYVSVIFIFLGTMLLMLETHKNPWYLVTCIFTSVISWGVLSQVEKLCEPYMDEKMAVSFVELFFDRLLGIFIEESDE